MKKIGLIIGGLFVVLLGLLAAALILALPLMWLWNWVMVDIFSLPQINYWKALGLYWLCGLLFNHIKISDK